MHDTKKKYQKTYVLENDIRTLEAEEEHIQEQIQKLIETTEEAMEYIKKDDESIAELQKKIEEENTIVENLKLNMKELEKNETANNKKWDEEIQELERTRK